MVACLNALRVYSFYGTFLQKNYFIWSMLDFMLFARNRIEKLLIINKRIFYFIYNVLILHDSSKYTKSNAICIKFEWYVVNISRFHSSNKRKGLYSMDMVGSSYPINHL